MHPHVLRGDATANLHAHRTRQQGQAAEGADRGGSWGVKRSEDVSEWHLEVAEEPDEDEGTGGGPGAAQEEVAQPPRADGCKRRHKAFSRKGWINGEELVLWGEKNPYWRESKDRQQPAFWAVCAVRAAARLAAQTGDDQDRILCGVLNIARTADELQARAEKRKGRIEMIDSMVGKWKRLLHPDSDSGEASDPSRAGDNAAGSAGGGAGAGAGGVVEPQHIVKKRDDLARWEQSLELCDHPRPPKGRTLADAQAEVARAEGARNNASGPPLPLAAAAALRAAAAAAAAGGAASGPGVAAPQALPQPGAEVRCCAAFLVSAPRALFSLASFWSGILEFPYSSFVPLEYSFRSASSWRGRGRGPAADPEGLFLRHYRPWPSTLRSKEGGALAPCHPTCQLVLRMLGPWAPLRLLLLLAGVLVAPL